MDENEKSIFRAWLKTRPKIIQQVAKKYPPDLYRVKQGAPYAVTCPGSIVTLYSYYESGEVSIVLQAKDKLPETIEHENKLCDLFGKDRETAHQSDIRCAVDPKWLEPI